MMGISGLLLKENDAVPYDESGETKRKLDWTAVARTQTFQVKSALQTKTAHHCTPDERANNQTAI